MDRLHNLEPGIEARRWLWALCGGIVGLYLLFFLAYAGQVGPPDADQFLVFHELQYWNAALFGLAKQWTPVMCSGLSLAGEPQVPFLSLSMMLAYVLGPFAGLKLATVIYFATGAAGAYLYSGLWMRKPPQRALAATLFIGNGFFACRLGYGHVDFIPFLVLPLVLWLLHRCVAWSRDAADRVRVVRLLVAIAAIAALLGVAVDGSPVAIIHLLFWIALYAAVLAATVRSWAPAAILGCAVLATSLLDAGYLWPMVEAQRYFPRRTPDSFTSFLSLIWFALLPVRGKLLPANGNGHELSVFIGPIIALAMWRYRDWLRVTLPAELRRPLLVVSLMSIVLGMGSLAPLHVPQWLSPFDILRPLPGFRSLGVTARYWGFLALPLSLLGAAALWRGCCERRSGRRLALWMGAALVLQFGFQADALLVNWSGTGRYQPVRWQDRFRGRPEPIQYVVARNPGLQGDYIAPARGVVNCYDMDDFTRARIDPGTQLVASAIGDWNWRGPSLPAEGGFTSWNRMSLRVDTAAWPRTLATPARIQLLLNQAYNRDWSVPGCRTLDGASGNLIVDCPAARAREAPLAVVYFDSVSDRAAAVSVAAWRAWLALTAMLALGALAIRVRSRLAQPRLPAGA